MLATLSGTAANAADGQISGQISGKDAAYIDWAVRNCEVASTDKEHMLIERMTPKDRVVFSKQYESINLTALVETPAKQEAMCKDIRAWYGPDGSRIAGLLKWERSPSTTVENKPAPAAAEKKRGRKRSSQ